MRKIGVFLVLALAGCYEAQPPDASSREGGGKSTVEATPKLVKRISAAEANRSWTMQDWKAEVLESDQPVLVDFWAPWCGPCRMMDPVIEALARDYKVRKVNIDNNPQLQARYKVDGIPALLVFNKGRLAVHFEGYTEEGTLREALEKLSNKPAQ